MSRQTIYLSPAATIAILLAFSLLSGCGEQETITEPTPMQTLQSVSTFYIPGEDNISGEEQTIYVVVPELKLLRRAEDEVAAFAILSMLTPKMRSNLERKGLVRVSDREIAEEIAIIAGIEGISSDTEIWIVDGLVNASWGCIKCCYDDPPCCEPCPECCDRDPKPGMQYGDEIR